MKTSHITYTLFVILFLIQSLIVYTVNSNSYPPTGISYTKLADAFLAKQLYIYKNPKPGYSRCGLDYSEYGGKCFIYFGPPPAIVNMIYKVLFGVYPSEALLLSFFVIGTWVFASLTVHLIYRCYFCGLGEKYLFFGLVVVVMASNVWCLQPRIYSIAVAGGAFFLNAGIYFVIKSILQNQDRYSLLAGLLLGLSIFNRVVNLGGVGMLLTITFVFGLILKDHIGIKKTSIICLFLGVILISSVMMGYNFLRFDNPLEIGTSYQRPVGAQIKPTLANLKIALWNYILKPPSINKKFPFVSFNKRMPVPEMLQVTHVVSGGGNRNLGLIFIAPYCILMLISINIGVYYVQRWLTTRSNCDIQIAYIQLSMFFVFLGNIITISLFPQIWDRYIFDFIEPAIISSTITWFSIAKIVQEKRTRHRILLSAIAYSSFLLALASILMGQILLTQRYDLSIIYTLIQSTSRFF